MRFLVLLLLLACDSDAASDKAGDKPATPDSKASVADPYAAPADCASAPADAEAGHGGLKSVVLKPGTGTTHAGPEDRVEVHYTGWTKDGRLFDSSKKRGQTATFGLNQVIAGWTQGIPLMVEGESRRFWIPSDMAYGDPASRPGAPAGDLTFDVELVKIFPAPKPIPAPEDCAAAPNDAKATKTGVASRVLQAGTGKDHPTPTSSVTVHYTGWSKDGRMFDSSVVSGEPATFRLDEVIAGWTEGLQLMVVGEKRRFWIPGELAYGDHPTRHGAPSGQLTFDIELLRIQ